MCDIQKLKYVETYSSSLGVNNLSSGILYTIGKLLQLVLCELYWGLCLEREGKQKK